TRGVLEGVTDGVTDDGRLVCLGALPSVVAVLHELLRVVPGPAGVGEEHGHEDTCGDGASEEGYDRRIDESEADRDRGEDREEPGGDQLTKRVLGADVDDARVLRLFRAVHDSGTSTELFANLHDDTSGSTSDRHDR